MSQDPPDEFDPLKLSKWSLPMVAAWIIWRNTEVVRAAWPKYRREVRNGKEDFFGSPSKVAVSLFDVLAWAANTGGQSAIMQGAAAQRELWHRLDNKELAAVGIPASENEARLIVRPDGTSEWSDDDPLFYLDHEGWPTDAIGRQFDEEPRYTQVRVLRDDVLKIWPADQCVQEKVHSIDREDEIRGARVSEEEADAAARKRLASIAGLKSGQARQHRPWHDHAIELIIAMDGHGASLSNEALATGLDAVWKSNKISLPGHAAVSAQISKWRQKGTILPFERVKQPRRTSST